jgi:hypothetical protein
MRPERFVGVWLLEERRADFGSMNGWFYSIYFLKMWEGSELCFGVASSVWGFKKREF